MKTLWRLRICLGFLFLCLCAPASLHAETRVLATTFPMWMMVRNVTRGVDGLSVELMVPAQAGCPHDYALSPRDMQKLERADIVVMNGLGLDDFVRKPLENRASLPFTVDASGAFPDAVLLGSGAEEHHEHDHGHDHPANPHLFASPARMGAMVRYTAERLAQRLPEYGERLRDNAEAWSGTLDELASAFAVLGENTRGKTMMTQHGAFDYLAADAGLALAGTIQLHEGQEPSASDMLKLDREIKDKRVAAIFTEPQYSERAGATLARENDIPLAILDPVAGGPQDAPLSYYEDVMRRNLETLERILLVP